MVEHRDDVGGDSVGLPISSLVSAQLDQLVALSRDADVLAHMGQAGAGVRVQKDGTHSRNLGELKARQGVLATRKRQRYSLIARGIAQSGNRGLLMTS